MTTDEIAAAIEAILATTASEHVRVHVRNISALLSERKVMREEIERLREALTPSGYTKAAY